ncbi:DEKNAAC102677 [Brettanomyces naardenensis]|uniref:DEKNAAC102677 n=1 Tax=Brettanomyces naardenensis TaxID=13370 RepID=A0A448YKM7_BRENA|nr:DEKNAAC102677 [Brettanomyces naardenensis]
MGLIDAVFILDDKDSLVFEHIVNSSSPTYDYVHAQLLRSKRELATNKGIDLSEKTKSLFDEDSSVSLECVVRLDSNWLIAWNRVDNVCILALGSVEPGYIEVYSDDEEEEGEEGDNEAGQDETDSQQVMKQNASKDRSVSYSVNPMQYLQFFKDFAFVTKAFLETDTLTVSDIESYSYRIAMILQEMIDASYPYITDLNQLRELLPDNSIIKKIISTTRQLQRSATSSLHPMNQRPHASQATNSNTMFVTKKASIFEKSGNEIPWRAVNLQYTQNEMLVDVIERIDYIIPSTGTSIRRESQFNPSSAYYDLQTVNEKRSKRVLPTVANIQGKIEFKSSLSGMPTIQMIFDSVHHHLGIPTFHKCVDLPSWISKKQILEFIPPDEKFTLMEYNIDLLEEKSNYSNFIGLVDAEMTTGLGIARNAFEIRLRTNLLPTVENVEDLKLDIYLPRATSPGYTIKVLRITKGNLQMKRNDCYEWIFDKETVTGLSCTLKGEIRFEDQIDADFTDDPSFDPSKVKVVKPRFVRVSYRSKGSVPSGITVKAVKVLSGFSSKVKPYKGVKYTTLTGDYILR